MDSKVSIIIPIYSVAEYLPRCIESVLAQSFKDFELILVDDGSPDTSGKICDEYARKDTRIRVFHIENSGAGAARKYGVEQAKGEWIEFIDGDDTIPSDSIEKLYEIAKHGEYDIVIGSLNLNNRGLFQHKVQGVVKQEEYIEALLLNNTSIGPVAKLYKSTLFQSVQWSIPKEIKNNEDLLMLIFIATKIKQVFISPEIVAYNYLYREGSASKSVPMPLKNWMMLFSIIGEILAPLLKASQLLKQAFCVFQIRRLYLCNVLQGRLIEHDVITKITDNIIECQLTEKDKDIWHILQNKSRQNRAYYWHICIISIKGFIKRIIGL